MEDEKKVQDASIEEEAKEEKVDQEVEEQEEILTPEQIKDRKIKNLISAVILLAGLFVGSLFVDVLQMIQGGGFSQKALSSTDIFSSNGKTWVAYNAPIVKVQIINDETCGDPCKPDAVLVGLKQAIPTMTNEKIDANSAAGKKLISTLGIKTLPAFVFSKDIENTDLFTKAQPFLDKQGDVYVIKSAEAGFPVGKYVTAPSVSDNDIKIGSDDAKVKVAVFSFFQSPTDKAAYQNIITPMLKDYGDKIQVVFKNYFPPQATQSMSAALAATCANDQGKFLALADKLYANQAVWGKAKDATPLMKQYAAQAGLNANDFNTCLDQKKHQDQVNQTLQEGQGFGLQATPSIFVGTDLQTATAKYDDVKKAIDAQLQ